jgi:hypothetical protein
MRVETGIRDQYWIASITRIGKNPAHHMSGASIISVEIERFTGAARSQLGIGLIRPSHYVTTVLLCSG